MCAPPRGLSQLTTSFVAVTRLGIHRVPFVACQTFSPRQLNSSSSSRPKAELRPSGAEPASRPTHPIASVRLTFLSYSTFKEPRPRFDTDRNIGTALGRFDVSKLDRRVGGGEGSGGVGGRDVSVPALPVL
jgi:hypothetical protein